MNQTLKAITDALKYVKKGAVNPPQEHVELLQAAATAYEKAINFGFEREQLDVAAKALVCAQLNLSKVEVEKKVIEADDYAQEMVKKIGGLN